MRGPLLVATLGIAPLLVLGGALLAGTLGQLGDPCHTWGDRWGRVQSGGGRAPGPPGCEGGTSWTTEARGSALLRAAWLPAGALVAFGLALWGLASARPAPAALAVALLVPLSFPLTLGITLLVAGIPAIAVAGAARAAGLAARPTTRAVGLVVAAAVVALLAIGLVRQPAVPPVALVVGLMYPAQLLVAAALLVLPRRG